VATVMATVAAPGDMKRNRCDQNDVQLMMIDHLIGTVVLIHTKFHRLIAHRRSQVPTAEELLVRYSIIDT